MLRLAVLLLVLANVGFYVWTRGTLDDWVGIRAQGDREPERLARQVHAELVRVAQPAAPPAAAADVPLYCLEIGPYTPAQIGAAEGVLQTVMPAGSWVNVRSEKPPVWIVYMGKFTNRDAMQKKIDELLRRKITFEEVHSSPDLEEGLSLGRYESRAAAERALADFSERGVRTARVAVLSPVVVNHTLRVERADAAVQARLTGLRADALLGKTFTECAAGR